MHHLSCFCFTLISLRRSDHTPPLSEPVHMCGPVSWTHWVAIATCDMVEVPDVKDESSGLHNYVERTPCAEVYPPFLIVF